MIKTVIVDDELNNIEHLQRLATEHLPQLQVVATADSSSSAYEAIVAHHPDLVLLDIQMGSESGFDLLMNFPQLSFEVIFITAFDHYGLRAIKFSAIDYLLKPVVLAELEAAVEKAVIRIGEKQKGAQLEHLLRFITSGSKDQQKIALPLQNEIRYASIISIVRLEASNNYSYVILESGEKLLVCKTLKEFAAMLKPYNFIRTHQSHLVNQHFVRSYLKEDGGVLQLSDKTRIPISKAHRVQVKEKLQGLI